MGGFWKLNGIELTAAQVRVVPTRLATDRHVKQAKVDQHDGSQYREKIGLALPNLAIDIVFGGRGTPKFDEAAYVQQVLEDDDVWTLEAPSLLPVYVFKNFKRAAVSAESWNFDPGKATGRVTLAAQALVDGIWVADGGTYCEPIGGHFTLQAGGTWLRDDGVNTGTTPKVRLPQQVFGYALGTNSAYQVSGVPNVGSVTIGGLPYEDFDVTAFLHPLPTVVGQVGVYDLCSAPTLASLGGPVIVPLPSPLSGSLLISGLVTYHDEDFSIAVGLAGGDSGKPSEELIKSLLITVEDAYNPRSDGLVVAEGQTFGQSGTPAEEVVESQEDALGDTPPTSETLIITNT